MISGRIEYTAGMSEVQGIQTFLRNPLPDPFEPSRVLIFANTQYWHFILLMKRHDLLSVRNLP